MFNKIHEKAYKKVKIIHKMTPKVKNDSKLYANSLKMTCIHMKTCTSHAKLYKNHLHSTKY